VICGRAKRKDKDKKNLRHSSEGGGGRGEKQMKREKASRKCLNLINAGKRREMKKTPNYFPN